MEKITLNIEGIEVGFDTLKKMTELLALEGNEYSVLVAWNDRQRDIHSPQCLKCEIKGDPGWEVYGRNHEGRLRISVNDDAYVFIYS